MKPDKIAILLIAVFAVYLFFHIQKINEFGFNGLPLPTPHEIYVESSPADGVAPIYSSDAVNCTVCSSPISLQKGLNNLSLSSCTGNVSLQCGRLNLSFLQNMKIDRPLSPQIGIATSSISALLTLLAVIIMFVRMRAEPAMRVIFSFILLVLLEVLQFHLAQIGFDLAIPAFAIILAYFADRFPTPKLADAQLLKEAILVGAIFTAFIIFVNLAISSYDVWGAYYFRHAETTQMQGATNYVDQLSYLGRQFTYPPVFFEFAASLSSAVASPYEYIRVPLDWIFAFLFAMTTHLLFRKFTSANQRLLASSLFLTQWAILLTASGIGLHIFAFTLLNIALLLLEASPVLSGLSFGLAFAAHPIIAAFFPFYHYATNKFQFNLRNFAIASLIGLLISLIFYVPIFLRSGLPYEIVPQKWGYLLSYGWDGMRFDFQFLLPLFTGAALYGLTQKQGRIPSLLLGATLLFNTYVSLRADLIVAMLGASLFPQLFSQISAQRRYFGLLLLLYILPNLIFGSLVLTGTSYYCTWGLANEMCASPMRYIATHTPSSATVATDPIYGHLEAWIGKRPVLADLYVEYADQKKWEAANSIFTSDNYTAAEKYNVTHYLVHDFYNHPRSAPGNRIYDNGFFHLHQAS